MATISITIPDPIAARVVNAVAYNNGYTDTVTDMNGNTIPNPISKAQFCKNLVKGWIKANVVSYEAAMAADAARLEAIASAEANITIGD